MFSVYTLNAALVSLSVYLRLSIETEIIYLLRNPALESAPGANYPGVCTLLYEETNDIRVSALAGLVQRCRTYIYNPGGWSCGGGCVGRSGNRGWLQRDACGATRGNATDRAVP